MKGQSIFKYYFFGTCIRYLQDITASHKVFGKGYVLDNIDSFLSSIKELELQVTMRASGDLENFREEISKKNDNHVLSSEEASKLRTLMSDIRKTLDAEIEGYEAFIVSPKRLDVKKLIGDVAFLLTPGIFQVLPNIAKYDLSEAGKCIAFERPTAAAFHLLRATESVLRHFYVQKVKQKRVDPMLWGAIVIDLRKRRKTKSFEPLYSNLDNIRNNYRNPTQHPEKIYDIHEVQDLWSLCTESIGRMISILGKKGAD